LSLNKTGIEEKLNESTDPTNTEMFKNAGNDVDTNGTTKTIL